VDGPRRELFQEWFQAEDDWVNQQDGFHRHSWPDQEQFSVCMRRKGARTVSYTVIKLHGETANMTYFPRAPDQPGPAASLSLFLHAMVSS
jgi:hypothetical protein